MRILIAEDDFTIRTMLAAVLKKLGHEVVETVNGAEALEAVQRPDAPALLILDWIMPEMDGIEVIHRVRTIESTLPPYIILLTIKDGKVDIIAGLNAGANDYLTKPFDIGELQARIRVGVRMVEVQEQLAGKVWELNQSLEEIKTLRGILPICSFCKKIRNDQGYWDQVESYVSRHTYAQFSHGICPECEKKHYSEFCDHEGDTASKRGDDKEKVSYVGI